MFFIFSPFPQQLYKACTIPLLDACNLTHSMRPSSSSRSVSLNLGVIEKLNDFRATRGNAEPYVCTIENAHVVRRSLNHNFFGGLVLA